MQTTILIFRTSISKEQDMERVGFLLAQYPQISKWNVDLEDWEKVLRIECEDMTAGDITIALQTIGIDATELE